MAEATNHYSRRTPADRDLRASDADRNAVGDILRREHVAGRLDADEYADRYGRCLEAKTYAQLDALIADLPEGAEATYQPGPAVAGQPWRGGPFYGRRRPWRVPVMVWLVVAGLLVALTGGGLGLWVLAPVVYFCVVRPLMWHSGWRSGWGRRGGCGTWM